MRNYSRCLLAVALVLASASEAFADRVELRSGRVVEGMFVGADSRTVRLLLPTGQRADLPIEDVVAVTFSPRTPPPPPPKPAAAPAAVLIPAGTTVSVRLTQEIDVDASKAGMTFKALVDDPVMVAGQIVVPRGAAAVLQATKVQQSGAMKGADKITLKLNSIAFAGRQYEVTTEYVETAGKGEGRSTARKVGGGVGLGALVGGIAGGGEGAAIGALVGGVAGAAIASGGEEHLKLAAETRLQFKLNAAASIRP